MKKIRARSLSLLLLLCLLLCTVSLTACQYDLPFGNVSAEDGAGDSNDTDAPGSTESTEKDDTPATNVNNQITITGNKQSTVYAAAKGLRSAVSVYCTFDVTTTGGSFWNPSPVTKTYYSTGSGVLYRCEEDGSAFVITNFHVVYNSSSDNETHISDQIYLFLYGMEHESYAIPAVFVGGSANYDIAVLRVNESAVLKQALANGSAAPVTVSARGDLTPGEEVLAIGNPSATDLSGLSVTGGIVSVDSEYITMSSITGNGETDLRVIRTDAAVNSGNSGGGMFNSSGELVGIVNAKLNSSSIEGIAYAIPVSIARGVADNVIDHCYGTDKTGVYRASLGLAVSETALSTVYDPETGLLTKRQEITVTAVGTNTAADGSVEVGDVILSITVGDKHTDALRSHHLFDAMLDARVGDTVTLTLLRDGIETTVSLTLTEENFSIF